MGGRPIFKGTRSLVESLFWHLEEDTSVNEFLEEFPSVKRGQVEGVLQMASKLFKTTPMFMLDENVA